MKRISESKASALLEAARRHRDHEFVSATGKGEAFQLADGGTICRDWDGKYLVYTSDERRRLIAVAPTVVTGRSEHVLAAYSFDSTFPSQVEDHVRALGESVESKLDVSDAAIATVERYVRELGGKAREPGRFELLVAFFGEVIRQRHGGDWKMVERGGVYEPSIVRRNAATHSVALALHRELAESRGDFTASAVLV